MRNKEFVGRIKKEMKGHTGRIFSLATLTNGDLVSGGEDNTIKIWDANNGSLKKTLTGHTSWIRDFAVLNGNRLVSGSEDRTIKIWDTNEGTLQRTLSGHTGNVLALNVIKIYK